MLDQALKDQLQAYLGRLSRPVVIRAVLDDRPVSREMMSLLNDIVSLSPLVSLVTTSSSGDHAPSFALETPGESISLQFAGLPLGHEFTSLVLALLQVGGHPPKLSPELIDQVKALEGPLHFETYYSQSCQNCPDVVQALNLMSVLNPGISHVAIDGAHFQEEVEQREILSVPAVFLNGKPFAAGRMGVEEFLAKLDTGSQARQAKALGEKAPFDVLVVGGGPAGAAAAIYAARKGVRTGVLAERFGGQVLDTLAIENFVSVSHTEGPRLAASLEQHVKEYDVDVMNVQRAKSLSPRNAKGLIEVVTESGASLWTRALVLSTGARWRSMNVPGEDEYRNKGVAYCPHCDGPLFKGKRVAVIGGGNSGVEAAIDLAGIVAHVTLLEFDAKLRADEVLQRKLHSLPNVTVLTQAQTLRVEGDGKRVNGLVYRDRQTQEERVVALEGIFVQIGLLPNTEWIKGTVDLSERGEILVNAKGQTNLPGVFAAGDCTNVPYKQIVIAMGEGAKAALSAFDYLIREPL